jgi:hypothetical protein
MTTDARHVWILHIGALTFGKTAAMRLEWLRRRGAKGGVAPGVVFRSKS